MSSKLKRRFSDFGEKIKTSVRWKNETVFILIALIFIIALSILIRLSPIFRADPLIKAFDPWVQFNTTEYLVNHGLYDYFHWFSNQTWYPEGIARYNLRPGLIFSTAAGYFLLNFLGFDVTVYDVAYYWPAVLGGLTVLIMYYLGKEVLDSRAGLLSAFFLAFSPGHMQRTVSGFFDNETIGVFSVLGTFLFFLKAVKTGKNQHALYSGLFLGLLCLSWGGLTFSLLLLPLTVLILILSNKFSSRLLNAYNISVGTGLLLFMVTPAFDVTYYMKQMEVVVPLLFLGVTILYQFFISQKDKNPELYELVWSIIKWGTIPILIIFVLVFYFAPELIPFSLGERMLSVLNPTIRQSIHLVASVGEHKPSPWSVFYFNSLIPVILTPLGVYFAVKRAREEDVLMLVFCLSLLYMTGSMIRIILLLAPALALIGGYGLSYVLTFYGSLFKTQQVITRRRKRQLRKTLGKAEAVVVFGLVGFLGFAQINHATTVSIDQMSWTELVAGGSFHDWEEALTYIDANYPQDAVFVSWWDYGYWLSMIGNVTTVNDNGTLNHTRLGATGMAMMQTNELYSAKVFQRLHADYVMVYFGHLLGGLGGDEGKWPWMLRICNDNTGYYKKWGWEEDNWYGNNDQVNTVFDESEYINSSTGLYEDKWFESTLVKLMFYGEATTIGSARTQLEGFYTQQIEGNEENNVKARVDDNGNTWKSHIPDNGQYDFKVFVPEYFSTNRLVKVFKLDYTALESSFEIDDSFLSPKGILTANINNTGTKNITISRATIRSTNYNYTMENNDNVIPAGETRSIWVDTTQFNQANWTINQGYNFSVAANVEGIEGNTFELVETTQGKSVEQNPELSINIDRDKSLMVVDSKDESKSIDVFVNVTNTGDETVKIDKFKVGNSELEIFDGDTGNAFGNNFILKPNQTEEYYLKPNVGWAVDNPLTVEVGTYEGVTDKVEMAANVDDFKLSILPEDRIQIEEEYVSQSPDIIRNLIPIDDNLTKMSEDGTLQITVKNTGKKVLGLERVFISDVNDLLEDVDFTVLNSESKFMQPGDTRKLSVNINNVERNERFRVVVSAISQIGDTAASDTGVIIPIVDGKAADILEDDLYSQYYTNETISVTIKNIGSETITLNEFHINGSTIDLTNSELDLDILYDSGNNFTLDTYEIVKFRINTLPSNIKINETNTLDLSVYDTQSTLLNQKEVQTELPPAPNGQYYAFTIIDNSTVTEGGASYGILSDGILQLCLRSFANMSIDSIKIDNVYLHPGDFTILGTDSNSLIVANKDVYIQIDKDKFDPFGFNLGDTYSVLVTMKEGPYQVNDDFVAEVYAT